MNLLYSIQRQLENPPVDPRPHPLPQGSSVGSREHFVQNAVPALQGLFGGNVAEQIGEYDR